MENKEWEKEFDNRFQMSPPDEVMLPTKSYPMRGWNSLEVKSFISQNFISKKELRERIEKLEGEWHARAGKDTGYYSALQDLLDFIN